MQHFSVFMHFLWFCDFGFNSLYSIFFLMLNILLNWKFSLNLLWVLSVMRCLHCSAKSSQDCLINTSLMHGWLHCWRLTNLKQTYMFKVLISICRDEQPAHMCHCAQRLSFSCHAGLCVCCKPAPVRRALSPPPATKCLKFHHPASSAIHVLT